MSNEIKFKRARKAIEAGATITAALEQVKMNTTSYYNYLRKSKGAVKIKPKRAKTLNVSYIEPVQVPGKSMLLVGTPSDLAEFAKRFA